jgi:hypothetical protein
MEPPPPLVTRPRGLALTVAQGKQVAEVPEPVNLSRSKGATEPTVFRRDRFPGPRDQEERGTCVAFATVADLEYHLYEASPKTKHHSEQFLFWACQQRDGRPREDGTR